MGLDARLSLYPSSNHTTLTMERDLFKAQFLHPQNEWGNVYSTDGVGIA